MITLKHIVAATDFSEPSGAALTYGRALARNFGATLHVVHVVGRVPTAVYGADAYAVSMPELQQELEDEARKQVAALVVDNDQQPIPVRQVVITSDAPAAAIVDYAAREHVGFDRDRHTRTGRRGTLADGQCRRARRPDRAVSGADCSPSGT